MVTPQKVVKAVLLRNLKPHNPSYKTTATTVGIQAEITVDEIVLILVEDYPLCQVTNKKLVVWARRINQTEVNLRVKNCIIATVKIGKFH
jgi:hypothetical protein